MPHPDELAKTLTYLATRQLREFAPPPDPDRIATLRKFDYRFDNTFTVMGQLLHLALLDRGASDAPLDEKTFWELRFSYKSFPCTLRRTLSGVKLCVWLADETGDDPSAIAKDIEGKLRSAVRNIQTTVVEPRVEKQRQANNVRVLNQHSRYAGFVSYFRTKLDQALSDEESPVVSTPQKTPAEDHDDVTADLMGILGDFHSEIDRKHEIAYLTTALLAGYFSLVHHRLVLLTGFSPAALEDNFSVDGLFTADWADQFALATMERQSKADQVARSDLKYLAKEYRNTLLHGGGGRLADGLFVEWAPGYHTMVTARGEFTDQFMLWQPALTQDEAKDVLSKIKRIEEWFRSFPYFGWVEADLPVKFDKMSVAVALEHLKKGTVAEYIEREVLAFDRAMNGER